jgi:FRG domain-containing protein
MKGVSGIGADYYSEAQLLDTFKLRARRYLDHAPRSDWEWLFEMQHHGLPTRLLDWTESYLVALYFAVRDADGKHDAAVWATNPWWINRQALGDYKLFSADAPDASPWQPGVPRDKLPSSVLAIRPVYGSARIQAQRGVFTIHGTNVSGLDSLINMSADACMRKFVPPAPSIYRIHGELTRAGITESLVLPELPGLCRELKNFFFGS